MLPTRGSNIVTPSEKQVHEQRLRALRASQGEARRKLEAAEDEVVALARGGLLDDAYDVSEHEIEDVEQIFAAAWQAHKALAYSFVHPAKSRWPHAYVATEPASAAARALTAIAERVAERVR